MEWRIKPGWRRKKAKRKLKAPEEASTKGVQLMKRGPRQERTRPGRDELRVDGAMRFKIRAPQKSESSLEKSNSRADGKNTLKS